MMKKFNKNLLLAFVLVALSLPSASAGIDNKNTENVNKTAKSEKGETLILRLNEIKEMDKSDMKSSDKKELRSEVKSIKKELKANGNGVYISVGGLIIVILLIVILL
jgi:hypothetical protein